MADILSILFAENFEPVMRLLLAAGLGGVIGLEREASGKPAGFRTNLLICLGAALLTQLSAQVAADAQLPGGLRSDPGRIAAQIVSGIGFLGAGTILHARGNVTGLTTAATLWVVAAIGMAVGAGSYVAAIVSTLLVMLALMILGRFEDHLLPRRSAEGTVRVVTDRSIQLVTGLEALLTRSGYQVVSMDLEKGTDSFTASFRTRGPAADLEAAMQQLLEQDGVRRVTLL